MVGVKLLEMPQVAHFHWFVLQVAHIELIHSVPACTLLKNIFRLRNVSG